MFDKYNTYMDMGNVVIRAFDDGRLVVTTVDYHDLEYQLIEQSIHVADQRIFIEQNIEDFLGLLWSKYTSGRGKLREKHGSKFVLVELT